MADYIFSEGELYNADDLAHYGVLGMKWGVRRASRRLGSAITKDEYDRAVGSLKSHRAKASAKLDKLRKKRTKLESEVYKYQTKKDVQASKMERKAAKLERKAARRFTSGKKFAKRMNKALQLNVKASKIRERSEQAKAMLAKNKRKQELFEAGISSIDEVLLQRGKKAFNK